MNTIIVGAYWGDEGKGKIVDLLAADSDWVVRYNGGDNAGHTLVVEGKKVVLHVLPAGVLQGKNAAIGPDVFFNPESFLNDIKAVEESGFRIKGRIVVDERAHIIMPYHIMLDGKNEEKTGIGTTKRGIGPTAKDKAERTTDLTVSDMIHSGFREKIKQAVEAKKDELLTKGIMKSKYESEGYAQKIYETYSQHAEKIRNYAGESTYLLNDEMQNGKTLLLEGAQGSLLDIVHGTRPYVTSSNCTAGGAAANLGINTRKFKVTGIAKAYPTRVGEGPFPTELGSYENAKKEEKGKPLTAAERKKALDGDEEILGRWIRQDGAEYGATTGRPRRTGHPDFVALRYSAMINGTDEWAITKIDILGGKTFKAAVAYKKNGTTTRKFPFKLEGWQPVYGEKTYFWKAMTEQDCTEAVKKGYDALPQGMKEYIKEMVRYTKVPVSMVSISPQREITVIKDVLKRTSEYLK